MLIRNWHFFFPLNALSNHLEQRVLQLFIKQYTRADVYTLSHDSASLSLITLHNFILFRLRDGCTTKRIIIRKTMRTTFDRGSNTIINCVFFFVSYVNCNVSLRIRSLNPGKLMLCTRNGIIQLYWKMGIGIFKERISFYLVRIVVLSQGIDITKILSNNIDLIFVLEKFNVFEILKILQRL